MRKIAHANYNVEASTNAARYHNVKQIKIYQFILIPRACTIIGANRVFVISLSTMPSDIVHLFNNVFTILDRTFCFDFNLQFHFNLNDRFDFKLDATIQFNLPSTNFKSNPNHNCRRLNIRCHDFVVPSFKF